MNQLDPRIADALMRLPDYLGQHVIVSLSAIALGLALSLPLALAGVRYARLRWLLLAGASLVQTIPSLALLALFYPLLLFLSAMTEAVFGAGFSALGFLPSLLALTLYSMLPILRNTVTGILGIDSDIRQAALGAGMTRNQSLLQVELPLALPVIMAGIRTASVWVIGTATLSTAVGQTSLGNYIFTGLQTQNWIFVLFGCAAAAILALAIDQFLALAETALASRNRLRLVAGGVGLLAVLGASMSGAVIGPQGPYVVGAKGFAEQYILAELMNLRLQQSGLPVVVRSGLGSAVIFEALRGGDVDVYVDYTGTIWTNYMGRDDTLSRGEVLDEMTDWLDRAHGVGVLGALGFENAYALAMRRDRAAELGIRSIADLAAHARNFAVGGDVEIFGRPEWRALTRTYGLVFGAQRPMQPDFMYRAVADGEVDVITAFSSDGRIAQFDLVLLDDPLQAIPPYDAVILIAPERRGDTQLIAALKPLVGAIDLQEMQQANLSVSRAENPLTTGEAARRLSREIGP